MRFTVLGSGSKGNATLVECRDTRVLIDCGFSVRELERRLAHAGYSGAQISGVLVTHEHGDHIKGVQALGRKYGMPVYMTYGTGRALAGHDDLAIEFINSEACFEIRDIQVQAYPVPHDANEPCQYVFSDGDKRIGMVSDLGRVTPHVVDSLSGCEALLVESNHDLDMLLGSDYPDSLKRRITGDFGHLSNDQAGELLSRLDCSRLQHIVAVHLSEKNNNPDNVLYEFSTALDCSPDWIAIADQDLGLPWRQLA